MRRPQRRGLLHRRPRRPDRAAPCRRSLCLSQRPARSGGDRGDDPGMAGARRQRVPDARSRRDDAAAAARAELRGLRFRFARRRRLPARSDPARALRRPGPRHRAERAPRRRSQLRGTADRRDARRFWSSPTPTAPAAAAISPAATAPASSTRRRIPTSTRCCNMSKVKRACASAPAGLGGLRLGPRALQRRCWRPPPRPGLRPRPASAPRRSAPGRTASRFSASRRS